ncbi:predicted protein [Sclerotinia sclerotiorum 1980 UF-70]|uniref:Uncharacterized protein n=1 Tax=Sclerotinia sclerotiorum (strain ATCC 18683 / 1980 / Ss-1) TaxID=665079 RepID=A7EWJ4_SCLS1|nr:predicted protein [Sclerotinia sclerotiorum 1980 UF-70]EDN93836.1 predicted protein [Sclerotinia sclerotiorum 1980 UF-70]
MSQSIYQNLSCDKPSIHADSSKPDNQLEIWFSNVGYSIVVVLEYLSPIPFQAGGDKPSVNADLDI